MLQKGWSQILALAIQIFFTKVKQNKTSRVGAEFALATERKHMQFAKSTVGLVFCFFFFFSPQTYEDVAMESIFSRTEGKVLKSSENALGRWGSCIHGPGSPRVPSDRVPESTGCQRVTSVQACV